MDDRNGEELILPSRVIRSARRSICIEPDGVGGILVRAPRLASEEDILRFVREKQGWIRRHVSGQKEAAAHSAAVSYAAGGQVPFLGKMIRLAYHDKRVLQVRGQDYYGGMPEDEPADYAPAEGVTLYLPGPASRGDGVSLKWEAPDPATEIAQNRSILERWYRAQAASLLRRRTAYYAEMKGLDVRRVRISGARTNWGSCNGRRGINYSYHLVMTGLYEMNYVVVHELSHIRHLDHSKAFYAEVEATLPDYRAREAALHKAQWLMDV